MGGNYYAEAFNNLSDSDDLSDGKKADWDIHLESDNNRVYGRDQAIFKSNEKQSLACGDYNRFSESSLSGVDIRNQHEQNLKESYEEDRRSQSLLSKESLYTDIGYIKKGNNSEEFDQSETEDESMSKYTID